MTEWKAEITVQAAFVPPCHIVHDIDPAKVEPLRARGASVADSAERVAAAADRTICMVETTVQAESVIAGERGIIRSATRGHIVICMSTIDPFVARRLADALGARGVAMLDAPVSGGTERAETGELSIIAGGAAETFEACRDLFKAMGAKIFHVGGLGRRFNGRYFVTGTTLSVATGGGLLVSLSTWHVATSNNSRAHPATLSVRGQALSTLLGLRVSCDRSTGSREWRMDGNCGKARTGRFHPVTS